MRLNQRRRTDSRVWPTHPAVGTKPADDVPAQVQLDLASAGEVDGEDAVPTTWRADDGLCEMNRDQ